MTTPTPTTRCQRCQTAADVRDCQVPLCHTCHVYAVLERCGVTLTKGRS